MESRRGCEALTGAAPKPWWLRGSSAGLNIPARGEVEGARIPVGLMWEK